MIRKKGTDELYSEAIDPKKFNREYEETDIPIEDHEVDFQPTIQYEDASI